MGNIKEEAPFSEEKSVGLINFFEETGFVKIDEEEKVKITDRGTIC